MDVTPLLRARSVAVVGASPKAGAFGGYVLRQLRDIGYTGRIVPVTPAYEVVEGYPATPSLSATDPVDLAAICLADERLLPALEDAARAGARAAVVFGTAAGDGTLTGPEQRERMASIARDAGMALLGAGCMGFFNFVDPLYVTGYPHHRRPEPGGVGFITHSGSVFSAIAKNTRDLRLNYCVSTGQELVTTAADCLRFLIDQPSTRVVGMFLETVRDPRGFLAALADADRRGIPVVVLKVGRSERGGQLALAHSGAIAGCHAAYRAVFAAHNVVEVRSLDEMVDTLELFAAGRTPTTGALAAVTDSGGERALLVDLASEVGVPFAEPTAETLAALRANLDPSLEPANPADLWGCGRDWQRSYDACVAALVADPNVGAFAYAIDFNVGSRLTDDYLAIAIRGHASTDKPFAVVANVSAGLDPASAATLRAAGIPVLGGSENGVRALGHLLAHAGRRSTRSKSVDEAGPRLLPGWDERLATGTPLSEGESAALLSSLGLPTLQSTVVGDAAELAEAIASTGLPVVLKTAMPNVTHKSEVDGVATGIASLADAEAAYRDLSGRLGPLVSVQRQIDVRSGTELFLGMTNDATFGPIVTLGAGGVWVETLDDTVSLLPPITTTVAREATGRLRVAPLLTGARGRRPVDLEELIDVVVAFGRAATTLAPWVSEIDINPLFVGPTEIVALDALVVPSPPTGR